MIPMNLFSGEQWSHRHREQTCGHNQGRRRLDELRKQQGNIYITIYKVDSRWEFDV